MLPGRSRRGRKTILPAGPRGPFLWVRGTLHWILTNGGIKDDEFVVDQRDLGDVARFTMKLYPEYLEGVHKWDKSKLLEGDDYDKLSEAEKDELKDSLKVYTLFDSVPELVDYVFALDVFYTGGSPFQTGISTTGGSGCWLRKIAGYCVRITPSEDHRMLLPWQGGDAEKNTWSGGLPALTTRR